MFVLYIFWYRCKNTMTSWTRTTEYLELTKMIHDLQELRVKCIKQVFTNFIYYIFNYNIYIYIYIYTYINICIYIHLYIVYSKSNLFSYNIVYSYIIIPYYCLILGKLYLVYN